MMVLKGQLSIFLIICVSGGSCIIDDLYDAGKKVLEFYSTLDEPNLISVDNPRTVEELFTNNSEVTEKIRNKIYGIHMKLREIENSTNSKIMNNLVKLAESAASIFKCIDKIGIYIAIIADDYKKFGQIIENGYIHNRPLKDLTLAFPDIGSNIGIIRKIMTNPKNILPGASSLIGAIIDYVKTQNKDICNVYQSIDEILIYLLKITIIAEIKYSLMWPFANSDQYKGNQVWKHMIPFAKEQFQEYFETYVSILEENLNLTTGLYMRACDPENGTWILNENYYDFVGIVQGMIFGYQPTECPDQSCHEIWQNRRTTCDAKFYDKRSGCSSTPIGCEKLGAVQACVLKHGPHKFKYVNSTNFGFFGNESECLENDGYMIDN